MDKAFDPQTFVRWFRDSSPYINAFRGRTFVVTFGGELIAEAQFASLVHDLALLNSLGVRLILVHGARPQIEARLNERQADMQYVNGLRITDDAALACVKEAVGTVRVEIEAQLSMGLANTPMAGARIRVASGNFVTAQPLGVRGGVDYQHTGELRRIDTEAIHSQLDAGALVLLSPVGYSPTGETFNLSAEDVAATAAAELQCDKLIYLVDGPGLLDEKGRLVRELSPEAIAADSTPIEGASAEIRRVLHNAARACRRGVHRVHLVDRHVDGSLLMELFTRDGVGTMVSVETFEGIRQATIDDVGGILELIEPLEKDGVLVRRSRERLEMEIEHFTVLERDGMVVACSALYPFIEDGMGELACLAVHEDYRREGRADVLLAYLERQAIKQGVRQLFVLTTRTAHWFQERGFAASRLDDLPMARQALYNYQRRSKVFVKTL